MVSSAGKHWSIYQVIDEALKEKELSKLRLAKCRDCGIFNAYKLRSLEFAALKCKKCKSIIRLV